MSSIEDKYEILDVLRKGGMGTLCKARHRQSETLRLVKVINSRVALDPTLRDEFVESARLARELEHPNLLRLLDFAANADGLAYLEMEFVEGVIVKQYLDDNGPPDVSHGIAIACQVLRAMETLHAAGMTLRDFSPDNVLMSTKDDGTPAARLIDLTRAGGSGLTGDGVFMGKAHYTAPEQFEQDEEVADGRRSDVYSMGVTTYEILTGRTPIAGKHFNQILWAHLSKPPLPFEDSDPLERVSPALREIVLRALSKQPEQRFGTALEFMQHLAPFAPAMEADPFTPAEPAGAVEASLDTEPVEDGRAPEVAVDEPPPGVAEEEVVDALIKRSAAATKLLLVDVVREFVE